MAKARRSRRAKRTDGRLAEGASGPSGPSSSPGDASADVSRTSELWDLPRPLRPERAWARTLAARQAASASGETPVESANAAEERAPEPPQTRTAPDKRPPQQPAIHRAVIADRYDDEPQRRVWTTRPTQRVAVAVAWVGITAVALVATQLSAGQATPTSAVAAATHVPATFDGAVSTDVPAPTDVALSTDVPAPTDVAVSTDVPAPTDVAVAAIQETFDGLPMDSPPGARWVVYGGDGASVIALPTSVDRSIRVRSSTQGEAATACRVIDDTTAAVHIGFDLLVGGAPPSTAAVVSLRAGERDLLSLGIEPSGRLVAMPGAGFEGGSTGPTSAPPVEGWGRVDLTIDGAGGLIDWRAHDATGAQVASGTPQVADLAGVAVDGVCFHSPLGTPSGWIAIDDLIVEG